MWVLKVSLAKVKGLHMNFRENINSEHSVLLVIDLQSKLAPAIASFNTTLECALQLANASAIHQIPSIITEHYKKGLGESDEKIKQALPSAQYIEKLSFSACAEEGFLDTISLLQRPHVVVIGTEAHVCVLQTCLDLLQHGYAVTVATDAIASRNAEHKSIAVEQLRQAGAVISCAETIIFQWTKKAGTSTFKQILSIVK
mgnify:FL=1